MTAVTWRWISDRTFFVLACLEKAFLLKDAQCSTLSQCQMVLKLYLEVFIPRNSIDRALKPKEVTFCSLSKCVVAYLDAVVVAFSVAFRCPGSQAALGVVWFFLGCWVGPFVKAGLLRKLPLSVGLDDHGALFQLKWFCVAFLVFWKDLATCEPEDQIPQPVPSVIHGMTLGKGLFIPSSSICSGC